MHTPKLVLSDELISKHTDKLKYWFDLLNQVMPDYFFNTFSPEQIQALLPALFNIHRQSGVQQITSENSVILIYLASDANNLAKTAKMMSNLNTVGAVIHESRQQIIVDGVPRTLVIEYYEVNTIPLMIEPLYDKKEVTQAYKKKYKSVPSELNEIYDRIYWNSVRDLNLERFVEKLHSALKAQKSDCIDIEVEKATTNEIRLTMSLANCPQKGFYSKIIECLLRNGFHVQRAYLREFTFQNDEKNMCKMPVAVHTLYLKRDKKSSSLNSKDMCEILLNLKHINWVDMDDLLHHELVEAKNWTLAKTNLMRAAAEFIHTQFSFIDRNAYNDHDIYRMMVLYEPMLKDLFDLFDCQFNPRFGKARDKQFKRLENKIHREIDTINTGMQEKNNLIKNICRGLLNFFMHIEKTNYYVENKCALSLRMNPAFMSFYEKISPDYINAFPKDRPFGVFYFIRTNCIGFHIRFSDIARGGWRTVIPKNIGHELERMDAYDFAKDEIFREVYVLAHTQHMKNKDIYEGGSKMICLLKQRAQFDMPFLYESQRSICRAFLDLINYDANGKLKNQDIIDKLGKKEIIEIGPDENMFDEMISWISTHAKDVGYTLKRGLISGAPETGINHKDYGVTSFGVHQYLLKTLEELKIDPAKNPFSVKISGGPYGDVAGNELKLLLDKKGDSYIYPNLKVVAITDGPAAAYDPDGLDKEELIRLIKKENLDSFATEKLSGEGAYVVFNDPVFEGGQEKYRIVKRKKKNLEKKLISRDEFMKVFQDNLMVNYADIFIPCGGRPSTINLSNWESFFCEGKPTSKAIVEGANSFITPDARTLLQEKGVQIIKDASANKCGVITSSYEILSGLILGEEKFKDVKDKLVKEIMEILRERAIKEAEWLFFHFKKTGRHLTTLTEQLSVEINQKNEEISKYLQKHKDIINHDIILKHLPKLFSKMDRKLLDNIPDEYKKAIVSVELACRIIYNRTDNLDDEIKAVL